MSLPDCLKSLHSYYCLMEAELNQRLLHSKKMNAKLKKILKAVTPISEKKEPKDDVLIKEMLMKMKGEEPKQSSKSTKKESNFEIFQKQLKKAEGNKWFLREEFSKNFVSRLSQVSVNSSVNRQNGLLGKINYLIKEIQRVNKLNLDDPEQSYYYYYFNEKVQETLDKVKSEVEEFNLTEKTTEMKYEPELYDEPSIEISDEDLLFKQTRHEKFDSSFFENRCLARLSVARNRITKRASELLVPYIQKSSPNDYEDVVEVLKLAKIASNIMDDHRIVCIYNIIHDPDFSESKGKISNIQNYSSENDLSL